MIKTRTVSFTAPASIICRVTDFGSGNFRMRFTLHSISLCEIEYVDDLKLAGWPADGHKWVFHGGRGTAATAKRFATPDEAAKGAAQHMGIENRSKDIADCIVATFKQ